MFVCAMMCGLFGCVFLECILCVFSGGESVFCAECVLCLVCLGVCSSECVVL